MSKTIYKYFLCCLLFSCAAFSQNRKIEFEHLSFEELKAKAQETKKNIFIDCYTTWCGPCKFMSKNIFTKDAVADFINKSYVSAEIDMETKQGIELGIKYEVEAYPTYLFLDSSGNLIYKFVGAKEKASDFIEEAKKGLNSDNIYYSMNLKFESGNRSAAFMEEYIKLKFTRKENSQAIEIANEYLSSLTPEQKTLPENWYLFGENKNSVYLSLYDSPNSNYLIDHWSEFVKHIPDSIVYKRIEQNYQGIASAVFRKSFFKKGSVDIQVFDGFQKKINAITNLPSKNQLLILMDVCKAFCKQDKPLVLQILSDNVSDFSKETQHVLFDLFAGNFNANELRTSAVYEVMRKVVLSNKNNNLINFFRPFLEGNDPHYEKFDAKNLINRFDQSEIVPCFHPDLPMFYFKYKKANQKAQYYAFDNKVGTHPLYNKQKLDSVMLTMKLDTARVTFIPTFTSKGIGVNFNNNGNKYTYIPESKEIIKVEQTNNKPVEFGISPDKKDQVIYKNYNIYLKNLKDSTQVQLTFDGDNNSLYLLPNIKWLGNGSQFIVSRKNDNDVRVFTVINSTTKVPFVSTYKEAIPGDTILPKQELFLGDVKNKSIKKIDIEKWKGQEFLEIKSDNPDLFYFTRLKRTHDELELCSLDHKGEVKVIIAEKFTPNINGVLFNCKILNKGEDILFWSDRTGWGHYYHYNKKGKLLNALTKGEWTAGEILTVDSEKQEIYFQGYGKDKNVNPNYSFLYKVKLDGSNLKLLTPENADHSVFVNTKGNLIIDNYSRIDSNPLIVARECNGKLIDTVMKPNIQPLLDYGWDFPEQFKIKAADNETDLYGIMWKPDNFDPNKKYPIISQVYPGPFTETVWTDFTVLDKYQNTALAKRGFIVVCFGHRGSSPIRNKAYFSHGFGNLRDYPLADDKYGLEQLAHKYSFIDLSEVGILGHSGGAFMAVTAISTYPDFYKVAVASSGNYDNAIYHKNWGEYYQGIGEDLEFKVKTPMELVSNLKGKLLLVTGESDQNVNPSHTYKLVDALIKADKDFDLLVIPGQGHHFTGVYDDYFERRKRDYFTYYLSGKAK
ncbi:DPP IV N-terminal domain-containing protein [Mariniflexile sp. HMF6888]|uniref:DPP IV N-terminal domain-containing protein n=1 Tax=Mariniflexile sp. HMF6888 TaxID=3373086 RepID=UPI003790D6CD